MMEIVSIFLTTIINEILFISFILSKLKNVVVNIKNYKLDYL